MTRLGGIPKASEHAVRKKRNNALWMFSFYMSILLTIVVLALLLLRIMDDSFGFVTTRYEKDPSEFFPEGIENADVEDVREVFRNHARRGIYARFDEERAIETRDVADMLTLVERYVLKKKVDRAWSLVRSFLDRKEIERYARENENIHLEMRSWISLRFLSYPQSSEAAYTGIRTALYGSLLLIMVAVLSSVPFGIAAAVYLEEYAPRTKLTHIIRINIYNLAGIPSIVYGLLGLAVFVRLLEPFTGGRTVLSGGLTLGLMCLPIIIINAQEAIRAVPNSVRYSSYAVGATKWQTIWHHVLPYSYERILTGIILAVSRAVGETAPLVVVGAATFISVDPSGIFSRFTALPIQIYQWVSRPQEEYRHVAAAAVVVLLVFIFLFNGMAFALRNHLSKQEKL